MHFVFQDILDKVCSTIKEQCQSLRCDRKSILCVIWVCSSAVLAFGIIYLKMLQLIYPYIFISHYQQNHLILSIIALIGIMLEIIIIVLGYYVFRLHFWLRHIQYDTKQIILEKSVTPRVVTKMINNHYLQLFYPSQIRQIIYDKFGQDIGRILMDYTFYGKQKQRSHTVDISAFAIGEEIMYDSDPEYRDQFNKHTRSATILKIDEKRDEDDRKTTNLLLKDTNTGAYGVYHLSTIKIRYNGLYHYVCNP